MILGQWLCHSEPQFPPLFNGHDDSGGSWDDRKRQVKERRHRLIPRPSLGQPTPSLALADTFRGWRHPLCPPPRALSGTEPHLTACVGQRHPLPDPSSPISHIRTHSGELAKSRFFINFFFFLL